MILLFTLFFTLGLKAQDCGPLKNEEEVRLDKTVLKDFKTQDQDGLGTCYANTTSLILHALSPKHQTPSYLQLATQHGIERMGKATDDSEDYPYFNGNMGSVCKMIEIVNKEQKSGRKFCSQTSSKLENISTEVGDPFNYQIDFLRRFRHWAEVIKAVPVRKSTSEAAELVQKAHEEAIKLCSRPNPNFIGLKLHLLFQDVFSDVYLDNLTTSANEHREYDRKAFLSRVYGTIFKKNAHPYLSGNGTYYLERNGPVRIDDDDRISKSPSTEISSSPEKFIEIIKKIALDSSFGSIGYWNEKYWNDLISNRAELKEMEDILRDQKEGIPSPECISFELVSRLADLPDEQMCLSSRNAMRDLSKVVTDLGFDLKKIITGVVANNPDEVLKEIGLDCDEKDKITLRDDLVCRDSEFDLSQGQTHARKNRESLFSSLKSSIPVGLVYCAEVLFNQPINRSDCNSHVSAIIGTKCLNGEVSYLVQNSWGRNFIPPNSKLLSEPGGKFWISEEVLESTIRSLNYVR